jgi:DNA-binding NarL/FixJ family response regulator
MAAVAADVTSVLVVDDDPLVRSALTLMLGGDDALTVVGEASDGAAGLAASRALQPDVVLMDIRMPVMNGIDATRTLKESGESPHVIVLTTFDADEHVLSALEAGADGFLLKDTPPADIVAAIQAVTDGEPMLSPSATRAVLSRIRESSPASRGEEARRTLAALTSRERDVALEVGRGLSNAEIAKRLHLSVPTVKAHVSRLFDKLQCTNRVQIAIVVNDAGLL